MQFIDLKAQQQQRLPDGRSLREAVDARIAALLDHGQYILGPEALALKWLSWSNGLRPTWVWSTASRWPVVQMPC